MVYVKLKTIVNIPSRANLGFNFFLSGKCNVPADNPKTILTHTVSIYTYTIHDIHNVMYSSSYFLSCNCTCLL